VTVHAAPVLLVTGATGQVGHELVRELAVLGRVVAPSSAELDLADARGIRETLRRIRPTAVVNAAAYTAVDRAESDVDRCTAINAIAPGILAEEAAVLGAALVHYSTDYVFDGSASHPYTEDDEPNPVSVYGATKLAGERAIQAVGGGYLILRTSWVYGARGSNFLRTMLRLARERTEMRVVSDQVGAPTWSRTIAAASAHLLRPALTSGGPAAAALADRSGVYHLASAGKTSWFDFACAILAGDPRRSDQRCERLLPIPTADYPTPARRPSFSLLDTRKLQHRFGLVLPDWREQLALVLGELPG
jgi:dTDP-4-dehydrorhamnose reductase